MSGDGRVGPGRYCRSRGSLLRRGLSLSSAGRSTVFGTRSPASSQGVVAGEQEQFVADPASSPSSPRSQSLPSSFPLMRPFCVREQRNRWSLCGQQSLEIFCLGILLSALGHFVLSEYDSAISMQLLVNLAGILVMCLTARMFDWYKTMGRTQAPRFAAPQSGRGNRLGK